ncbi:MAG: hypothetical protein Ct9H300mP5_5090 [Candidatus Pelagibacterales bacterium]|nr:MAG: hypothetical protein Ct9H300mP5_5090 [Pelagibacterales bacterium]
MVLSIKIPDPKILISEKKKNLKYLQKVRPMVETIINEKLSIWFKPESIRNPKKFYQKLFKLH